MSNLTALIIGSGVAVSNYESGASLRVQYLKRLLEAQGYQVEIKDNKQAKIGLDRSYDLILITSYSCASLAKRARQQTKILWFDPYDSWINARFSLLKRGKFLQLVALLRDIYFTSIFPQREITSFISVRDAKFHPWFLRKDNLFILPIHFTEQLVTHSTEARLIFVGDGNFRPNQYALPFLNKLGKKLGLPIWVIGQNFPYKSKYPYLTFLGYVDSSDLFKSMDIHIVPIRYGSGIKTKVALPLSLGLRVVSSKSAAVGIRRVETLKVANSIDTFAATIQEQMNQNWKFTDTFLNVYESDDFEKLKCFLKMLGEKK